MRFHLVDRIDSWIADRGIRARKLTSASEEFWRRQPDGRTIMPAPLILEALCQAGTWLVMLSSDYDRRAALLSIERADFESDVVPGDVLVIDGTVVSQSAERAVLDGTVTVGERRVLTATGIMCVLMATDRLDDPAAVRAHGEQLLGGVR
ncbi:3-hydroxyacyl-[acyl-carrier-protein] dehydratase [Nocardia tenerifensis]|uniref:3-hydroxyacyl-[acyl-carrier-protein] dehydratase n=1 Tax=Nocardia tenerifensis TaxID=228006 RepID=A0A318K2K7_9NOCA|nr:3-hydroxylacyl-ACP dehydratase [Nocardia tenerifensis]PXX55550.1 3-hydroxyacyl-[acyl-carrier-protein] dehydratase [Nocardia tenerifensis]